MSVGASALDGGKKRALARLAAVGDDRCDLQIGIAVEFAAAGAGDLG